MGRDKRIDEKIAKAAPFARPILEHLRALVHETLPGIEEAIKWGMPHFVWQGKNVAGMAAFKAHCAFMIHGEGRQGMEGGGMGSAGKIASLSDLPPDAELKERLREAQGLIDRGEQPAWRQAPRKPKPKLAVPQDFAAALNASKAAQQVFDAFSPSQKREYVAWITEAKADATRERRLKQAIEWIAQGKRRNWKYETR
jgi:uncharacterized protein YdeI (YjbR/CyaY-like superfamily)